jgi:hypothetical protein
MKNHLKQLGILALTAQLFSIPLLSVAAVFTDVQSNWAQAAIQNLASQSVISGYPDGTFRPEGEVTRAEFSAILVKALALKLDASGSQTFSDVPTSSWAYPSIETVRKTGLVSGYPNGVFLPNKSITRAEALAVLANAARVPMPSREQADQLLSGYADAPSIPGWARTGTAATIESKIFANNPEAAKTVEPLQPATRAEVAAMVENLKNRLNAGQSMAAAETTEKSQPEALKARITTVPSNTRFTGTLGAVVSSELNKMGDEIILTVDQPLKSLDNLVIIPVNSKIVGKIVALQPAARTGKSAQLDIDFTEIVTPSGQHYAIQGSIATEDGMLHGDSAKGRILKAAGTTAVGAGLGAALGTAMGPLSGGKVGKGAVYGTAVGATTGAVAAVLKKGNPIVVGAGEKLEIKLDQPINVQVNQ